MARSQLVFLAHTFRVFSLLNEDYPILHHFNEAFLIMNTFLLQSKAVVDLLKINEANRYYININLKVLLRISRK